MGGAPCFPPQLKFTRFHSPPCPQEKSSGRTAHYKLTSTVMLWLQTNKSGSGTMNLGGSLTRQVSFRSSLSPGPTATRSKGALCPD